MHPRAPGTLRETRRRTRRSDSSAREVEERNRSKVTRGHKKNQRATSCRITCTEKAIKMSETQPNDPPRSNWTVSGDWHLTSLLHDQFVDSWKQYRVCVRHACADNEANRALRRNNQLETTHAHHALVGNCLECMRVGFIGMRCMCNTGGTPRYIVMLNGQQLRGDDPTAVTTYSVVIRFFTESLRLPQFPPWTNTDVRV